MITQSRWKCFLFAMLLLAITGISYPSPGYAEVKEIIAEGTYCMGDGETPLVAEDRALVAAKRTALEQAGTYVESYSETKNYQLTADDVKTIASGIMEVTVLDKRRTVDGSNINFWVKIRAVVTLDKIEDMAAKVKELSLADDYKKLQADYDKSQQDIATLKRQLQEAQDDSDKQRIRSEIAGSEALFQANTWFERGNRRTANHEFDEAINAYTEAISLNPHFGQAYLRRGSAHGALGEYQAALGDFESAIHINPQLILAYFGEGRAYEKLGYRREAIMAYRTFIEYASPDQAQMVEVARHRIYTLRREFY